MIEKDTFLRETQDPYKSSQYFPQFHSTSNPSYHKLIDNNYKRTKEKVWDFYSDGKFKKNNFYADERDTGNLQLEAIADRQAHLTARIDRDMQQTWGLLTKIRSNLATGLKKNDDFIYNLDRWAKEGKHPESRNPTWDAQKNRDFGNLEDFERIQKEIEERRMGDYAMLGVAGKDARRRFLGDNFQEHFLGEGEVYKEFLYKKKIYDDIVHKGDVHYMPKEFMLHKALYGDGEKKKYQRAEVLKFQPHEKKEKINFENFFENDPILENDDIQGREGVEDLGPGFKFVGFDEDLEKSEDGFRNVEEVDESELGEPRENKLSLRGDHMVFYEKPRGQKKQPGRRKSIQKKFEIFKEKIVSESESEDLDEEESNSVQSAQFQRVIFGEGSKMVTHSSIIQSEHFSQVSSKTSSVQTASFQNFNLSDTQKISKRMIHPDNPDYEFNEGFQTLPRNKTRRRRSTKNLGSFTRSEITYPDSEMNEAVREGFARIQDPLQAKTHNFKEELDKTQNAEANNFKEGSDGIEIKKVERLGDRDVTFEVEVARFIEPQPKSENFDSKSTKEESGFNLTHKALHIEKSDIDSKSELRDSKFTNVDDKKLKFVKKKPELKVGVNTFKEKKKERLDDEEIERMNDQLMLKVFKFKEKKKKKKGKKGVKFQPSIDQIVKDMEKERVFTPEVRNFQKKKIPERKLTRREVQIAEVLALERERKMFQKKIKGKEKKEQEDKKKQRELDRTMATVRPPPDTILRQVGVRNTGRLIKNEIFQENQETQSSFYSNKYNLSQADLGQIEPSRHFMSIKTLADGNNIYAVDYIQRETAQYQGIENVYGIRESFYTEDQLKKYIISAENSGKKVKEEEPEPDERKEPSIREINQNYEDRYLRIEEGMKLLLEEEHLKNDQSEGKSEIEENLKNDQLEGTFEIEENEKKFENRINEAIEKVEKSKIGIEKKLPPSLASSKSDLRPFNYINTFESPKKKSIELGSIEKNYFEKKLESDPRKRLDFTELQFYQEEDSHQSNNKRSSSRQYNRMSGMTDYTEGSKLFNYTMTDDDKRDTLNGQSLTFLVDPFEIEERGVNKISRYSRRNEESGPQILLEEDGGIDSLSRSEFNRESIETCDHEGLLGEIERANNTGLNF